MRVLDGHSGNGTIITGRFRVVRHGFFGNGVYFYFYFGRYTVSFTIIHAILGGFHHGTMELHHN